MGVYVRVEDGRIVEVIDTGDQSLAGLFHPDFIAALIDVSLIAPQPQVGMTAVEVKDGWSFAEYTSPKPTAAEILAANTAERDRLLVAASLAIAPLQDAVDLDEATAEELAMLKKWKQHRVAVNRVDLAILNVEWPTAPG